MEARTSHANNNFARLSNDLIAYRSSESDRVEEEANGSLSSYHPMHLSSYEGQSNNSQDNASRASTMKYDRRHNSESTGIWRQQGQDSRNGASSNSASAYSATSRRGGQNTNRPSSGAGEVRTSCLVKSPSGFGLTVADSSTGHVVKVMAESLGRGQLQPGDVIVMIDGIDVRRQSHENTVTMLKSYPPGSAVIFSYVRPNGDRNLHLRPHSAIPKSSLYSASIPLQSTPMNGGGGGDGRGGGGDGRGGKDGMGVAGVQSTIDHRTTNHRMQTTHPVQITTSDLNGTTSSSKEASSSIHYPHTVSFVNSTDSAAGDASPAAMKTKSIVPGETKDRRHDSRRLTGILRRSVMGQRRRSTTPLAQTPMQRPCWMSPTSSVSSLNFSGTPDFIPASRYRPSLSTSQETELTDDRMMMVDAASVASAVDRSHQRPRAPLLSSSARPSTTEGQRQGRGLSESSNDRGTSLFTDDRYRRMNSMTKSFDCDNRLQQMTIENHHRHQPLYPNKPTNGSETGRRDSATRTRSDDVSLKEGSSIVESVPQSLVYNADIHRGSRGFGFSIRGGKEFNGMPLLVLDIAQGGPADMDGRLKNGDQILSINGFSTTDMTHERAIELIQNACSPITLVMKRTASNAKRQSRTTKATDAAHTKRP